jgi:hypothetical protein
MQNGGNAVGVQRDLERVTDEAEALIKQLRAKIEELAQQEIVTPEDQEPVEPED